MWWCIRVNGISFSVSNTFVQTCIQIVPFVTWFLFYHIGQGWKALLFYLWLLYSLPPPMDVQSSYRVARVCVPAMVWWGHVGTDVTTWRTANSADVVWDPVQKTTRSATEDVCLCLAKSRMIKRSKKNCRFYRVMKIKSMNKVLKTSKICFAIFGNF